MSQAQVGQVGEGEEPGLGAEQAGRDEEGQDGPAGAGALGLDRQGAEAEGDVGEVDVGAQAVGEEGRAGEDDRGGDGADPAVEPERCRGGRRGSRPGPARRRRSTIVTVIAPSPSGVVTSPSRSASGCGVGGSAAP